MSLVIEARMLFKIKAIRSDLRKFSGPDRFLIILNLNELEVLAARGKSTCIISYVQSQNVAENKGSTKGITENVYQNKSLIKKCQNVIEK
jgi:hypothetical protein